MRTILYLFIITLLPLLHQNNQSEEEINYPSKNELLGKINPKKDTAFVRVDPKISYFPEVYLRKQTYQAFLKMREAALEDGIKLTIKSGTRTFYEQRYLWNQKFDGKRKNNGEYIDQKLKDSIKMAAILEYSAIPGISRHHWGTDIDINKTSHSYFKKGEGKKVFDWLTKNANEFGFYQVYTPFGENRKTGFKVEEWHWTYKPESEKFTQGFKSLLTYEDLVGFKGDKFCKSFRIIEDYALGIDKALLD